MPIQGAFAKLSAAYVPALAEHFAVAFSNALRKAFFEEASSSSGVGLESAVSNDVLCSGRSEVDCDWHWKKPGRIHVLESNAFLTLLNKQILERGDVRITALLDSRVAKGAHAKGRSSSLALQPSLRKSAAGGLYPSFGFAPRRLNVADDPTRLAQVRDSCKLSICDLLPSKSLTQLHSRGYSSTSLGGFVLSYCSSVLVLQMGFVIVLVMPALPRLVPMYFVGFLS